MWTLQVSMKKIASATLKTKCCHKSSGLSRQQEIVKSYYQVVSSLLSTYATENIVKKANATLISFPKS